MMTTSIGSYSVISFLAEPAFGGADELVQGVPDFAALPIQLRNGFMGVRAFLSAVRAADFDQLIAHAVNPCAVCL
jgi:hypothetical protein